MEAWRPMDISRCALIAKTGFFEYRKWLVYHLRLLSHKKLTKAIPVEYGWRFARQHKKLAKSCWDMLSDTRVFTDREVNERFRSAHFLFATFCTYQAINILEKMTNAGVLVERIDGNKPVKENVSRIIHFISQPI
jgi:hypothetical protein